MSPGQRFFGLNLATLQCVNAHKEDFINLAKRKDMNNGRGILLEVD